MPPSDQPLARRAAHRAPASAAATHVPSTRREARRAARAPRRTAPAGLPLVPGRFSFPAVAAATAAAFVLGGVSAATLDTAARQEKVAAEAAAQRHARADRAATVRLTAGAAGYAAARQAEALEAAHAALADADAVLASAPAVLGPETVSPLDEAVAELTALLAAAPRTAPARAAATDPATDPSTQLAAAVPDVAAEAAAAKGPEQVDDPVAKVADVAPLSGAAGAGATDGTGEASGPASRDATRAAADDVGGGAAGTGLARPGITRAGAAPAPSGSTPAPTASPRSGSSASPPAPPASPAPDAALAEPTAVALSLVGVPEDVLDLETSDQVLTVARQVAALSAQVRVLADAIAAELAAAEEAAAARRAEEEARRLAAERAALEAALRRLSTRIAATDAAPNGAIPLELLCRPRFTNVLLRCDAAQALERLNEAYRAAFGRDLAVSDGYRTLAEQERARATKGDLAAQPGTSNHGRALAVDFSGFGSVGRFDDPDYLWMVENAGAFGWVHPPAMGPGGSGPLEPWHWEFGRL